jgi:ATP-dependent DNA ligase
MLCESAERPPEGREWRYELKLDGFRAVGRKAGRGTRRKTDYVTPALREFAAIRTPAT